MNKVDDKYDVIIIGAGIGGLSCGCYLAKAGMKTLIVEQHSRAGGYCTSFKRNGFIFDVGVHALGAFRKKGQLKKIYDELNLNKLVNIIRIDPSDIIKAPEHTIIIKNDIQKTIEGLKHEFPNQADSIENFFSFLTQTSLIELFVKLKGKSFQDVLDCYFDDQRLKSMIGIVLWNMGLSIKEVAALPAVVFYKEFVFDGGYYPMGGMQNFADALAKRFRELGGNLLFSKMAKKIIIKNKIIESILLGSSELIETKFVVSNCDCRQTFFELVGKEYFEKVFIDKCNKLKPCMSAFIVYLAVDNDFVKEIDKCCALWYLPQYRTDDAFFKITKNEDDISNKGMFCLFPSAHDNNLAPHGKGIIILIIGAEYKNRRYWESKKEYFAESLIKNAEKIMPGLSKKIIFKEIATPSTLHKYTLNMNGALHGWQATLSQVEDPFISQESPIKGLYLAGHWVTQKVGQGGIAMVSYSGRNVARLIIRNFKKGS